MMTVFVRSFLISSTVVLALYGWQAETFEGAPTRCRTTIKPYARPQNKKEAFSSAYQCPASDVAFSKEGIEGVWSSWQEKNTKRIYRDLTGDGLDLQSIKEFNLKATLYWDRLVACYGDPEKAREAYLSHSIGSRPMRCNDVARDLANLRSEIVQFLGTSKFSDGYYAALPEQHPLIVEFLLESLSAIKMYWYLDLGRKPSGLAMFGDILLNVASQFVTAGFVKVGDPIQKATTPKDSEFVANLSLNALTVLSQIPSTHCSEWGLFPRATAWMMMEAIDQSLGALHSLGHIDRPEFSKMTQLVSFELMPRLQRTCPLLDWMESEWILNSANDVVKVYRSIIEGSVNRDSSFGGIK